MSQRNIFYYDQASNLICVRDTDLGLTYYEYDLLDRLTSVKNRFGEVTYYEYTADDEVSKQIHGNGAVSYYSYDPVGRVSRIEHRRSDLSEIATLDYEYDRVGNPTKITREDGSATYYSYDRIYQLTGEVQMAPGGQVECAFEYDYDGAHNRTLMVANGTPTYYEYNAANQLLTETTGGETTYYHYDRCGNTVTRQEASGTIYFAYDTENLMTRVDLPEGGHCYYQYDADGKRVGQDTAEGHRTFVYEGPDMLKLQMERDENDQTIAQYTMGNGLAAMRRDDASRFYHYNHLGTTLALTDAEEAVTDTYRHDAWGVLLKRTGTTDNPHTYVGRERYYSEADVALLLLGLRYYAPQIGRFVTVDPLRHGVNWFCYASNWPHRVLDPQGRQGITVGDLIGAEGRAILRELEELERRGQQWQRDIAGFVDDVVVPLGPYYLCWATCMLSGIAFHPGRKLDFRTIETALTALKWFLRGDANKRKAAFQLLVNYYKHVKRDRRVKHGKYSERIARAVPGVARGIGRVLHVWRAVNAWQCVCRCSPWIYLDDPIEAFANILPSHLWQRGP